MEIDRAIGEEVENLLAEDMAVAVADEPGEASREQGKRARIIAKDLREGAFIR